MLSRLNYTLFKPNTVTRTFCSTEKLDLLEDHLYKITARNSCAGIFKKNGAFGSPGFLIARSKSQFPEIDFEILFSQGNLEKIGTAISLELIEKAPPFENDKKLLEYLLKWRDTFDPSFSDMATMRKIFGGP